LEESGEKSKGLREKFIGKLASTSTQGLNFTEFAPSAYILKELAFSFIDVSKDT
jgi:hypothetical protein